MFKFIFKALAFAGLLVACILMIFCNNNPYLEQRDYYKAIWDGYEQALSKVVMLGDSHARYVGQKYLPKEIYNLGYDSDGMKDIYIKFRHVLGFKKVQFILIEIDEHFLSALRENSNNENTIVQFAHRDDFNEFYGNYYGKYLINKYLIFLDHKIYPLLQQRLIKLIQMNVSQHSYQKEANYEDLPLKQKQLEARARGRDHFHGLSEPNLRLLKQLVEEAKRNGVSVIGIKYPVSAHYLNERAQYYEGQLMVAMKTIPFMKILDFSNTLKEDGYFENADHVNDAGAKRMSAKLVKILKTFDLVT